MPNIAVPEKSAAPAKSQELLSAVERQMGTVPNIFLAMANSPATLEAYLQFSGSLSRGKLSPTLREQIALATAGKNGCDYCASAHTFLGRKAGLNEDQLALALKGESTDAKTTKVLGFVREILETSGNVRPESIAELSEAEFTDEEIVEIVGLVGMNIFTNYFNHVVRTTIDFPLVSARDGAACGQRASI